MAFYARRMCKAHYSKWMRRNPDAPRLYRDDGISWTLDELLSETAIGTKSFGGKNCREWQMSCSELGYGLVSHEGGQALAHRVAYRLAHGELPKGKPCVLHHCDNPPCIEPSHLFAGTKADNTADMMGKGRDRLVGERNAWSKLTADSVRAMRREREEHGTTYRVLADKYGITLNAAWMAVNRRTWRNIE